MEQGGQQKTQNNKYELGIRRTNGVKDYI